MLFLSDGKNWNDIKDRERLNSNESDYQNFALCLSYSYSENVAMWMLYARKGCMIKYKKEFVLKILETDKIFVGYLDKSQFVTCKELGTDKFEIELFDMIYYGEPKSEDKEKYYYIKRSTDVERKYDKSIVEELTYQKKEIPWAYENECRIVIKIKKADLPDVSNDKKLIVAIPFSEDLNEEQVVASPNGTDTNGKYAQGELAKKIQFNICEGCNFNPNNA